MMSFKCLRPPLAKYSQEGKESSNERSRMVLGIQPSSFQKISTKGEPSSSRLHSRTTAIESNRKNKQAQISRSPVFAAQEGLLSLLNKHINIPPFKMTSVEIIRNIISNIAYTVSIDLKDAYWHILIAEYVRPYLGFIIRGQKFQF